MKIIPAIDILDGKCVRLSKGDYNTQKIYNDDPLEVALEMEAAGIKYLHVVDLDGARAKHICNHRILEKIAANTGLQIDFGGGIKSCQDVQIAFDCGASQITLGSIAVDDPELIIGWLEKYGNQRLILGADCKHRKVATHGWLQESGLDVVMFIKNYMTQGLANVICTDIEMDGMMEGPSIKLYEEILSLKDIQLIASGGISCLEDLEQLKTIGCSGAIIGKAIYEKRISLKQLSELC